MTKKIQNKKEELEKIESNLELYVPNAALPYIFYNKDKFVNQLRRIVTLFVSLGIELKESDPKELDVIFKNIQLISYQ